MQLFPNEVECKSNWDNIILEAEKTEREWIKEMRKLGVKAAHPNDGWVDRERNIIDFCYPQFYDSLQAGDVCALGKPNKYVLVILLNRLPKRTIFISGIRDERWYFEYK